MHFTGKSNASTPPRPLMRGKLLFAHLSSDRRGDLLVQSSGGVQEVVTLLPRSGGRFDLPLRASGAMRLLPGSRDLLAF